MQQFIRVPIHTRANLPVSTCCSARIFKVLHDPKVFWVNALSILANVIDCHAIRNLLSVRINPRCAMCGNAVPMAFFPPADLCISVARCGIRANIAPFIVFLIPRSRAFSNSGGNHDAASGLSVLLKTELTPRCQSVRLPHCSGRGSAGCSPS